MLRARVEAKYTAEDDELPVANGDRLRPRNTFLFSLRAHSSTCSDLLRVAGQVRCGRLAFLGRFAGRRELRFFFRTVGAPRTKGALILSPELF